MTPIEQAKEALQEVSDTMDRKGGVAPIIRMDTLKKVNAALALLKTMEGPAHSLSLSDAIKVWNLLPEWVRLHSPGLDPTFYGTLSAEGDAKVRADMVRILGIDRINVTHANVSQNISEETICALRDMLAKAYVFEEAARPSPQSDTLATLTLSMTEEEIDRIGREQYPPDTTNDGEPWYNHEQATRNMYFKDGLRYASTHTKTITVDQIMEVAAEWLNEMEGMHSYMNTSLLRDRLTSKFK